MMFEVEDQLGSSESSTTDNYILGTTPHASNLTGTIDGQLKIEKPNNISKPAESDLSPYQKTQKSRQKTLQQTCQKYKTELTNTKLLYSITNQKLTSFHYSKYLQALYLSRLFDIKIPDNNNHNPGPRILTCLPPKSGSSNWQRLFIYLIKDGLRSRLIKTMKFLILLKFF